MVPIAESHMTRSMMMMMVMMMMMTSIINATTMTMMFTIPVQTVKIVMKWMTKTTMKDRSSSGNSSSTAAGRDDSCQQHQHQKLAT